MAHHTNTAVWARVANGTTDSKAVVRVTPNVLTAVVAPEANIRNWATMHYSGAVGCTPEAGLERETTFLATPDGAEGRGSLYGW